MNKPTRKKNIEPKKANEDNEDFSYLWISTGDVQDMWDALYREEKEIEEILAKRK